MNSELDLENSFYTAGGTLRIDAPSYITRKADDDLYYSLKAGHFSFVLTSRQMGKSSLMVRAATRLRRDKIHAVVLDLTAIGKNLTPEQWYGGLLNHLGQQVDLEDELEEFWLANQRLGVLQRFTQTIRNVVLKHDTSPLVIFVDEIDGVRSLPFSTDEFFAAIRELYNRRVEDPELFRLTFCLVGTASPTELIRDTRNTPFNIGRRIQLNDFTIDEAAPLGRGLGPDPGRAEVLLERIHYWTHGHPFLTQSFCLTVAQNPDVRTPSHVDRLCEELFFSRRARDQDKNLIFVRNYMGRSDVDRTALLSLYQRVLRGGKVRNSESDPLVTVLLLSGVACVDDGWLKVRNRIYAKVFDRAWVKDNMPNPILQKQLRRAIGMTVVASLVAALFGGLALFAWSKSREADREREKARQAALIALRTEELEKDLAQAGELLDLAETRLKNLEAEKKIAEQKGLELEIQAQLAAKTRTPPRPLQSEEDLLALHRLETEKYKHETELLSRITASRRLADESMQVLEYDASIDRLPLALLLAVAANRGPELLETRQNLYSVLSSATRLHFPVADNSDAISSLAYSRSGVVAAGSQDGAILILEHLRPWTPAVRLEGPGKGVSVLAFSRDGSKLAVGGSDGTVQQWDLAKRSLTGFFKAGERQVIDILFTPDASEICSIGADGNVWVWNPESKRFRRILTGLAINKGSPLALSADCRYLAVGDERGVIMLRSVLTDSVVSTGNMRHFSDVSSLTFSPDGRFLASGSNDGEVRLWDLETFQERGTPLKGHYGKVLSLTFSPDGQKLASGGLDATVLLWDTESAIPIAHLRAHSAAAKTVAFSPDGGKLVSGGANGVIYQWDVSPESWMKRACRLADRNLTQEEWERYVHDDGVPREEICPGNEE